MTARKINKIMFFLLCAILTLTGCTSSLQRDYQAGEALLEQGNYEGAAAKFESLGSFDDASRLLMYSRAAFAAENGNYTSAINAFSALGAFRDSPEMLRYYQGRAAESIGRDALITTDTVSVIHSFIDAARIYESLSGFSDTAQRKEDCLNTLYSYGVTLLDQSKYTSAQELFDALGAFRDSNDMSVYCSARSLEEEGSLLDAAHRFLEVSSVLDASARAERDLGLIYQQAMDFAAQGDPETAITLFQTLGSFRDAEAQKTNATKQLLLERLKNHDYEGALFLLDTVPDVVTLQHADAATQQQYSGFLNGFVDAYLHFSAGSMDAVSGYYGLLPFIEQGGTLDKRLYQVLAIGSYSHNSNYIFYGSELLDLQILDYNCYIAFIRATASVNQPVGPVEVTRTFRILFRDAGNGPVAETLDDYPLEEVSPSGRPVYTGPLPNGQLPSDEDGDGIIIVDVMKKGFSGTMIIVLDPSRVFVGGPGFYGGNGMILEDLVRRYDALGGINGGGFIDEDGGGSGGLPEGLTILDGESYHWAGNGASAAFDVNNVLHVGYYSIESAAAAGIRDCVSFGPALIIDGVGEYGPYMESGINPRTAIGQRGDGSVLLLCIDGRQLHSIGASFADIRDVMLDFGAINACSLDGGSSTVMYYDGKYLNSPSSASGTSRYLPNAFLIRK